MLPSGVILGLRRDAVEICTPLGYYTASSGNFYRRFGSTNRSHHKKSRIQKDLDTSLPQGRTDTLSQNFSKKLPQLAAS